MCHFVVLEDLVHHSRLSLVQEVEEQLHEVAGHVRVGGDLLFRKQQAGEPKQGVDMVLTDEGQVVGLELEVVQMEFVDVLQQMLWQEQRDLRRLVSLDLSVPQRSVLHPQPLGQQENQQVQQLHTPQNQPIIHQVDKIPDHLALGV